MNTKIKKIIIILICIIAIVGVSVNSFGENDNLEYMKYKDFYENVENGSV